MKYVLPIALVSALMLQACDQNAPESPEVEATDSAVSTVSLETSEQRLSYGIAYGLGQRMATDNVPLDVGAFTAGLNDAIDGTEPRLSQEEISAEMQSYQEKAAAEQQAAMEAAGEKNKGESEAFLAENGAKDGVVTTASGLQYEVVKAGEGPKPSADDTVEVHYTGTLIDGTEFDSSHKRGEPVTFGVSQVIPGWTEALQLMPVGSEWKLYIPSELAYGAAGSRGAIGPNAALIFDVELLSIPSQEEAGAEDPNSAAKP